MGQVTSYTAAKIDELIGEGIVNAELVNYHLVVTTKSGNVMDLGSVRGAAGPTGGITEAAANVLITAAINAARLDNGYGVLRHDEVATDQSFTNPSGTWVNVSGLSIAAWVPVPGRMYEFVATMIGKSNVSDTTFDLEIQTSVGAPRLGRDTTFCATLGQGYGLSTRRMMVAPSDWNTARTISCRVRSDVSTTCSIENTYVPGQLSIIDHGVI